MTPDQMRALYGTDQGPALLGRTYSSLAVRVAAARKLSGETGGASPALELLDAVLSAVAATDQMTLLGRLSQVQRTAARFSAKVVSDMDATASLTRCSCYSGNPEEMEGPDEDCPQHGRCQVAEDGKRCTMAARPVHEEHAYTAVVPMLRTHLYDDGAGGTWEHNGPYITCTAPECDLNSSHVAYLAVNRSHYVPVAHSGFFNECPMGPCKEQQ